MKIQNPLLEDIIQTENIRKAVSRNELTPGEMAWAIFNTFGRIAGYNKAANIGIIICDMLLPYMPNDKMTNNLDNDCTEYWKKVKLKLSEMLPQ